MPERLLVDQSAFEDLCSHIRDAGIVAFDTEFISESTYIPDLCLLQFATPQECVAVDPLSVKDLSSWWEIMADASTTVLVHAGREEVRFSLTQSGQSPRNLVDVQIAQGIVSRSYPLGYSALVARVLGHDVHGTQTRTDWRVRPLSKQQIHYALDDVLYVGDVWKQQRETLESLGRLEWAQAEFSRMVGEVSAERGEDQWRRLSGLQKLRRRELAIARALYLWREQAAESGNKPPRRVLRDDLLLDLARRKPKNAREVLATRDMNRSHLRRAAEELAQCIAGALEIPDSELPARVSSSKGERKLDEEVLGRLLGIALANRCAELDVSTPLVGTNADLRHLVRWHVFGERNGDPPRLSQGWRAEVCGDLLTDVLDGKITLRVANPDSDHPLVLERRDDATG